QSSVLCLPLLVTLHEPGDAGRSGYLLLGLRLDRLTELWAPMPLPAQHRLVLIDTRGMTILANRNSPGVEPEVEYEAAEIEQLASGTRVGPITEPDGQRWLRSVSPVDGTPWVVLVDIGADAVVEPI